MHLLTGVALAGAASALYNLGLLLQAEAARRDPAQHAVTPALLGRLAQRRRWIAGSAIAALGWPLQALALTRAPLTVVQPTLSVGLVLPLALGARLLREPVRHRDILFVALLAVGVSLLAVAAPPRTTATASIPALAATLAALAVVVLLAFGLTLRPGRLDRGLLMIVAAGVAFALASMTTKLLADALSRRAWLGALLWGLASAAAGGAGLLGEMSALQKRSSSNVASLVFALETIVPVALSPLLFGEVGNANATTLVLRAVALATTVVAAISLTRTALVIEALAERPP